jgi:hypothetical protein
MDDRQVERPLDGNLCAIRIHRGNAGAPTRREAEQLSVGEPAPKLRPSENRLRSSAAGAPRSTPRHPRLGHPELEAVGAPARHEHQRGPGEEQRRRAPGACPGRVGRQQGVQHLTRRNAGFDSGRSSLGRNQSQLHCFMQAIDERASCTAIIVSHPSGALGCSSFDSDPSVRTKTSWCRSARLRWKRSSR